MGKKGFERHQRKYSAKQQASNKFSQKSNGKRDMFGFQESDIPDTKAIGKIIDRVVK